LLPKSVDGWTPATTGAVNAKSAEEKEIEARKREIEKQKHERELADLQRMKKLADIPPGREVAVLPTPAPATIPSQPTLIAGGAQKIISCRKSPRSFMPVPDTIKLAVSASNRTVIIIGINGTDADPGKSYSLETTWTDNTISWSWPWIPNAIAILDRETLELDAKIDTTLFPTYVCERVEKQL
jgi:hypothetical protein